MPEISTQFPEPLQCLFKPKRYKVLFGGRGAGRSWGVARALLIIGTMRPIRVLCCRELQNSITESVHKLLSDQISNMELDSFYDIQVAKITGKNGTSFSFEGIKNNTTKIKSYEGITHCWVEEANKVSYASWESLIPTIRQDDSEIWITFNPELETDYTYRRFVIDPAGDLIFKSGDYKETTECYVIKMTWKDNPWFPEVLMKEMEDLRKRDPDAYLNVWEGNCRQMLEGTIFAKEMRRCQEEGRITLVPWDRETPVDTFWDLGRRDMTSIWFAQRVSMQYRVLAYFEDSQEDIHYYLRHLQSRDYTYGTHYLPHDAKAQRLGQKRSIEQIVRSMGHAVQVVPRISQKVNAINAARIVLPTCWFDEDECKEGLVRLRNYRYKVIDGQLSQDPLHDDNSNGADAFMTMAQSIKSPKQRNRLPVGFGKNENPFIDEAPGLGWMR